MDTYTIESLEHYISLWEQIHNSPGHTNWDHILPYYHKDIVFRDTVQTIHGIDDFTKMTERLSKRSQHIEIRIVNSSINNNVIFIEWELIITYKKFPSSTIFGVSRTTLEDGKIINQRDYYDLWGDIFDNIKFIKKGYRKFMKKRFG